MTRSKIAISLPRDQLARAHREVRAGRADSVSGYIAGVLAAHEKRESLRALLSDLIEQSRAHRAQACLDITQALAISQLREGHCQILIPTRESTPMGVAAITRHTLLKLVRGHVIHELGKYGLADIHPSLSMNPTIGHADTGAFQSPENVQIEKSEKPARPLIQNRLSAAKIF